MVNAEEGELRVRVENTYASRTHASGKTPETAIGQLKISRESPTGLCVSVHVPALHSRVWTYTRPWVSVDQRSRMERLLPCSDVHLVQRPFRVLATMNFQCQLVMACPSDLTCNILQQART